jgi:alkanesulfonate monooxygenase SsuD/methylene tetrahydromethanopterin reductase-like flavin-dependent oxidoreductase (luciferase family)
MLLLRSWYESDDGLCGAWSRTQLLEMDAQFVAAVQAAFQAGLESPVSARATVRVSTSAAVAEEAILDAA